MLAQGISGWKKGTDTIFFIHKSEILANMFKDVTWNRLVCQVQTEKKEQNCTRATLSWKLINYPEDMGTPMADLLLIKIFFNSVRSTPGARFANADMSIFYLNTPQRRHLILFRSTYFFRVLNDFLFFLKVLIITFFPFEEWSRLK